MRSVLVTGARGFVGTVLCDALAAHGMGVRRALRGEPAGAQDVVVGDMGPGTDWTRALQGVDAVVHLAARAHVMQDSAADPLAAYRGINVLATHALARAAAQAGVRRFVYVSSIKVNGESTGAPFSELDVPQPQDAYGRSKWEAEQSLREIATTTRLPVVILRPPLIYGPGVKGNFLSLLRAIDRGLPLPLAAIRNRRSLLYVGNLADALVLCLEHEAAAGQTYLVADDTVSTPDLVRQIAQALDRPARLVFVPPLLLRMAGAALGKSAAVARLLGSLEIDSSRIRRELGWLPRTGIAQGLGETARWYHRHPGTPRSP